MSKPVRYAFVGKAGSGKTTMSNFCTDKWGCMKISLAQPVKRVARIKEDYEQTWWLNECTRLAKRFLNTNNRDPKANRVAIKLGELWTRDLVESESRRELLQRIGTDSGRGIDPEIWVDIARKTIMEHNPNHGALTVDDVRFLNEAEMLREKGFRIVKIGVPETVRDRRLRYRDATLDLRADWTQHPSETEMDEIEPDLIIDNSLDDNGQYALEQLVNDAVKEFGVDNTEPSAAEKLADANNQEVQILDVHDLEPKRKGVIVSEGSFDHLYGEVYEEITYNAVVTDDGKIIHTIELTEAADAEDE